MRWNSTGWDGGYYRRAYFGDGSPLGTKEAAECRIDAISQAWAVLAGRGRTSAQKRPWTLSLQSCGTGKTGS